MKKGIVLLLCLLLFMTKCSAQSEIYDKVQTSRQVVALCIEDVDSETDLKVITNILKQENCFATFFCSTEFVERSRHAVGQAITAGYDFQNHGHLRQYWGNWSVSQIRQDIRQAENILREITGQKSKFVRPPYQFYDAKFMQIIADDFPDAAVIRGTNICDWTLPSPQAIIQHIAENVKPGMILNLNIKAKYSLQVLPALIKVLKDKGYSIESVGKLIAKSIVVNKRPAITPHWTGIISQGPSNKPFIALTFDDGGSRENAVQILDVLKYYQVPCTFFLLGDWIAENSDLVRRMLAEGHEIANHTYSHFYLSALTESAICDEVVRPNEIMRMKTGTELSPYFRPPYGEYDDRLPGILKQLGYRYMVLWDIDTRDWSGMPAEHMVRHVLENAHNGSIVLFHLQGRYTVQALRNLIPQLQQIGFSLTKISEMVS